MNINNLLNLSENSKRKIENVINKLKENQKSFLIVMTNKEEDMIKKEIEESKLKNESKKEIIILLEEIKELKSESRDFNPLCDIHGICEATETEEGKKDGYTSSCYFCGAELEIYKGNYYHYSAFNLDDFEENYQTYQTHNFFNPSGPCTEDERKIEELEDKIIEIIKKD